jgi:hypothetical protein
MPTPSFQDRKDLERLVKALEAIIEILDRWQSPPPSDQPPAGLPEYDLSAVAAAFEKILAELNDSGPDGHDVYKHFAAIADDLRAAADALQGTESPSK